MSEKRGPYLLFVDVPSISGRSRFVVTAIAAGPAMAIRRYLVCNLSNPVASRKVE
jgi:hypothetical protein